MRLSVYEVKHNVLREQLRDVVLAAAVGSEGGFGLGSVQWRASATLYALLRDHPIDRRGRCRSCRRPGALVGRRRRICRVYLAARCYLCQPEKVLLRHLAGELNHDATTSSGVGSPPDPDDTEVLPTVAGEPSDALTERPHAPAVPPPLPSSSGARTGRPVSGRGGAGELASRRPRSRRAQSDEPTPPDRDTRMAVSRAGAR